MPEKKRLINASTMAGCPDFSACYEKYGYQVSSARTLRKALSLIKQQHPDVIVAEFVYAPTYGSQLSNFESLFAAAQAYAPDAAFIALVHQNDAHHFAKVRDKTQRCLTLTYPITRRDMEHCLETLDLTNRD